MNMEGNIVGWTKQWNILHTQNGKRSLWLLTEPKICSIYQPKNIEWTRDRSMISVICSLHSIYIIFPFFFVWLMMMDISIFLSSFFFPEPQKRRKISEIGRFILEGYAHDWKVIDLWMCFVWLFFFKKIFFSLLEIEYKTFWYIHFHFCFRHISSICHRLVARFYWPIWNGI